MADRQIVLILGNTCVGKTTLGHALAQGVPGTYLSFGDIKREEVTRGSGAALAVQKAIRDRRPIDPSLGFILLEPWLQPGTYFLSGYPIGSAELMHLEERVHVLGWVHLHATERTIHRRFFSRGVCPRCAHPGVLGTHCPQHGCSVVPRSDRSQRTLHDRLRLYHERIAPFLEELRLRPFPGLELDSDFLHAGAMIECASRWVMSLIEEGERG